MSDLDYAVETVLRRERDAFREALERVTKERDEARQLAARWVSPEAFDAALREIHTALATGAVSLDAVIAAAKAKHGGGK